MPNSAAYINAVKETFRSRALRTALIIDDQFPTYADMFSDVGAYSERERALALYRLFKEHEMPCDIENRVDDVAGDVERIRKSDLIVLDYHLTRDSNDPSKSVDLVRQLAETKHFNTVVVYTREPDLENVWLNLACALRQGWRSPEDVLKSLSPDALTEWERLADEGVELPGPTEQMLRYHVLGGQPAWPKTDRVSLRRDLESLGVRPQLCESITLALIHREVRDALKVSPATYGEVHFPVVGNFAAGAPLWLQVRNCFVVILGKRDGDDAGHPTDANRVLECLDDALAAWRPNLIQIIVSEIQNILELEALATDEDEFRDPATHTGLTYYLLDSLGEGADPQNVEQLTPPLQALIDKLIESLRHKLVADKRLMEFATTLLAEELKDVNWPEVATSKSQIYDAATRIVRTQAATPPSKLNAMFALNTFLSTERFRRSHLTTGTIFRDHEKSEYWVCASPSCDLVARVPSEFQSWAHALHPLRSVVAVRLHSAVLQDALMAAHLSKYAFLKDGEPRAFSVLHGKAGQPVYEFFFADDAGKWRSDADGNKIFRAFRIKADAENPDMRNLVPANFVIVGQLRPAYAARILHLVGQHLSRIGLDFVDMP
jgi:Response receiver domain